MSWLLLLLHTWLAPLPSLAICWTGPGAGTASFCTISHDGTKFSVTSGGDTIVHAEVFTIRVPRKPHEVCVFTTVNEAARQLVLVQDPATDATIRVHDGGSITVYSGNQKPPAYTTFLFDITCWKRGRRR